MYGCFVAVRRYGRGVLGAVVADFCAGWSGWTLEERETLDHYRVKA